MNATTWSLNRQREAATNGRGVWRFASPQAAFALAGRLQPLAVAIAVAAWVAGLYIGFFIAPTDHQQGEAYRIIFVHVPAAWLSMVLYLPLSLLFWHAPGLVHWHGVPPVKSLFFSIVACVRNLGAFTMYGLGWMGVFAMGGVVVSLLAGLLGGSLGAVSGIMVGLAMVMATMLFGSIVFTFRDCFEPPGRSAERPDDEERPATPPPTDGPAPHD